MSDGAPESSRLPPVPVLRWSLANATGLSALYLVLSAAVELTRRVWNPRWAERASFGLERVPARTLDALGLLEPLRRRWQAGEISDLGARALYGLTAVALIYVLGLVVGGIMYGLVKLARRHVPPPDEEG